MAGQPKRRQIADRIEELGGIDWLCEKVANGNSLRDLAAEHVNCSRWSLNRWIKKDPDRERLFYEAKIEGAGALIEEGKKLLDDADVTNTASVQKARNSADFRKWMASVFDRQSYGPPDRRTSININNIEHLHLAALQAHGGPDAQEQLLDVATDVPLLEPGDTFEDPHENDGQ